MAKKDTFLYTLVKLPGLVLLGFFEFLVRLTTKDPPIYDTKDFPWVAEIEANYKDIRNELTALLSSGDKIPGLQEIFKEQEQLTEGDDWKSFMMHMYGYRIDKNCDKCPKTDALLQKIPGMTTAMFSILSPGKHIPAHTGPFKGVLRFHLGLIIPKDWENVKIRVGDQYSNWREGKGIVLDDTHNHEVWNNTDEYRAVLFVDFTRKLPFPVSLYSKFLYEMMRRSPFIQNVVKSFS